LTFAQNKDNSAPPTGVHLFPQIARRQKPPSQVASFFSSICSHAQEVVPTTLRGAQGISRCFGAEIADDVPVQAGQCFAPLSRCQRVGHLGGVSELGAGQREVER
jgi:hypothetical protein